MKILNIIYIIIIILVIYYIIHVLIIKRNANESFISGTDGNPLYINDEIYEPYNKINLKDRDIHYFLSTDIIRGNKNINKLQENNKFRSYYKYINNNDNDEQPHLLYSKEIKQKYPNKSQIDIVKKYQPTFFNKPVILNKYDNIYYYDKRFPEMPINLDITCKSKNKIPYPCAKIYSFW